MLRVMVPRTDRRTFVLDIRSLWSRVPPRDAELRGLGVEVTAVGRLLGVDVPAGCEALLFDSLDVILDPKVEALAGAVDDLLSLDVFYHPGVTDAEGESAVLSLSLAAPDLTTVRCWSGTRFQFAGSVASPLRTAVERLLGNSLIHTFVWSDNARVRRNGSVTPIQTDGVRSHDLLSDVSYELIELHGLDNAALACISREHSLALNGEEMSAIAAHFELLQRAPTDVELQSLAQTWSEHCSHKTFKATIDFRNGDLHETIPGLLNSCIVQPSLRLGYSWVRSAFSDNAGVIAFDDGHDIAFKVETHNHPSALEPFGGAHTGVGGVIRDVLAVSAEPIANTDVLCFGPPDLPNSSVPDGVFHPHTTLTEVVRGVADYGNNMGIPTVGGAIIFHPGYTANPLVYCGTIGIAPVSSHPRDPRPGDAVLLLGGRTGADGLHGATMSSTHLDRAAVEGTVVQIGNPITEKTVRDVLPLLRDEKLYHAVNDCGAGGLCSAVGEMGESTGVEVDLETVPLKYPGLRPWEIWLSEAQERMVLAVAPESVSRVRALCKLRDVEATVIGRFRDDGRLVVRSAGKPVVDLSMRFLHRGRPHRRLEARWEAPLPAGGPTGRLDDAEDALLSLLQHPTIASKEAIIRRYDHEVGARTVVKPLVGHAGPSDAAVLKPLVQSWRGVVVSHGINPLYGADPYAMAMLAVDEALRNLVAVGGSIGHAALLDNFCWGDVDDPAQLGSLVRAAQGCRDAVPAYGVPFISGKDSLYNTSAGTEDSIPGTLLISAIGVIGDVRRAVTMDLKAAGNHLYLLGGTANELGGSFYFWLRNIAGGRVPGVRAEETTAIMTGLTRAMDRGVVRSCHDLAEGGLAVAAAEMAVAGHLGLTLDLDQVPVLKNECLGDEALLFGESSGRFLVEVSPESTAQFEALFAPYPHAPIGTATARPHLTIRRADQTLIDLDVDTLAAAWRQQ